MQRVIGTTFVAEVDLETFRAQEAAFRAKLAALYDVPEAWLRLSPSAGSLVVNVTIVVPSAGAGAAETSRAA